MLAHSGVVTVLLRGELLPLPIALVVSKSPMVGCTRHFGMLLKTVLVHFGECQVLYRQKVEEEMKRR